MTWRSRLLWFVFGVAFSAASYSSYCVYQAAQTVLHDPYYVEHVAAYVINYMKKNDNRWPTSWEDLRQANLKRVESGDFPKFEVLKENVIIDWNARSEILVKAKFENTDQPAFRVIWLRNGKSIHWSSTEPNRLIWEYLQQNKDHLPKSRPD